MRSRIYGVMALAMFLIVGMLAPASAGNHDEGDGDNDRKVWVCKYVGQPFVSEAFKGGKNPIHVSVNTLRNVDGVDHEDPQTGDSWTDAQGLSNVIVSGPGDCVGPDPDKPDPDKPEPDKPEPDKPEKPDPEMPEPDLISIVFVKSWTGDEFEGSDGVTVTFTVSIDSQEEVTIGDGEPSEPFGAEADWDLVRENVEGFPDDECSYAMNVGSTIVDGDGNWLTAVSNHVTCDEAPDEDEPEPDVELGDPQIIERGDDDDLVVLDQPDTLPVTGSTTVWLTLLALLMMASGTAMLFTRRQED